MRASRHEAHSGGAHRSAVPRDLQRGRRRPAASQRGGAADTPPDLGQRGRARSRRRVPDQGGGPAAAGAAVPETGRAGPARSHCAATVARLRHGATVPGDSDRRTCAGASGGTYGARQGGAAFGGALRAPGHDREGHAREAAVRPGVAESPVPLRGHRAGGRPRARRADRPTRAAEVRGDRAAAGPHAPVGLQPAPHPGAREARGVGAGSGAMHVRRRHGAALRVAQVLGVRPCGPGGARRSGHGAGPASSLSRP